MSVHEFPTLECLDAEKGASAILGVNFNDTTQGAKIDMLWETEAGPKKQTVTINAPIGEIYFHTNLGRTSERYTRYRFYIIHTNTLISMCIVKI